MRFVAVKFVAQHDIQTLQDMGNSYLLLDGNDTLAKPRVERLANTATGAALKYRIVGGHRLSAKSPPMSVHTRAPIGFLNKHVLFRYTGDQSQTFLQTTRCLYINLRPKIIRTRPSIGGMQCLWNYLPHFASMIFLLRD